MYHIFFICSSVDEHLGCFHVLAVVKQCCSEHWGTCIFSDHVFLQIYMPRSPPCIFHLLPYIVCRFVAMYVHEKDTFLENGPYYHFVRFLLTSVCLLVFKYFSPFGSCLFFCFPEKNSKFILVVVSLYQKYISTFWQYSLSAFVFCLFVFPSIWL